MTVSFKTDGFLVTPTKDNVSVGCVLRSVYSDGNVPSYADCTVVAITGGKDQCSQFGSLANAIKWGGTEPVIHLHRPMLYADGKYPNFGSSVVIEKFKIGQNRLDFFKLVMNAGGANEPAKPANYFDPNQ